MSGKPTEEEVNDVIESVFSRPDNIPAISGSIEFWKSVGLSDEFIEENMVEVNYE